MTRCCCSLYCLIPIMRSAVILAEYPANAVPNTRHTRCAPLARMLTSSEQRSHRNPATSCIVIVVRYVAPGYVAVVHRMDSGFPFCPPCVDERAGFDCTGPLVAKDTAHTACNPSVRPPRQHSAVSSFHYPVMHPDARHGSTASPFGH